LIRVQGSEKGGFATIIGDSELSAIAD
jgi:hypothetical protein